MKLLVPTIGLLMLGACAHGPAAEPQVRVQEVVVERPVACVPSNLGSAPGYPDTDEALAAAPDAARRYALLWAGRVLRVARAGEVEPVITGCREAGR